MFFFFAGERGVEWEDKGEGNYTEVITAESTYYSKVEGIVNKEGTWNLQRRRSRGRDSDLGGGGVVARVAHSRTIQK